MKINEIKLDKFIYFFILQYVHSDNKIEIPTAFHKQWGLKQI